MRILSIFCLILISFDGISQQTPNGKISIPVTIDGVPAENATVELRRSVDSALVKTAISQKNGIVEFENIKFGSYYAKINMVGYTRAITSSFTLSADNADIKMQSIVLNKSTHILKEVAVEGKRPFIQKLTDRIVVNVDNSIVNAGSTAMEVLERSPGITIDQNDQISLRGKSGVIIMVDGKVSPMSGADLANYLRGLPSNALARIEIITNPSSKYDAAGNSGIIDIRMKKDQRMGANGTFTAGAGHGVFAKANTGVTLNYRNKKVNVFGNYNYAYRKNLNHLILDRNFFSNGMFNGQDKKDNYTQMPVNSNTVRFGMDYFPGKKTIIGFVVNSAFNHFTRHNDNSSLVIDAQKQPTHTFKTTATNNDHSNNIVANINFKHTIDSTGKEITADADYGRFNSNSLSTTATKYFRLNGGVLQPDYILNGDQEGKLTLQTAKIDYVNPLKNGAKFEAGVKTSYVSADNDAKFFDASRGTPQNDVNKTNHFFYEEYNNAGYVNFSKNMKKISVQFGLRGERTDVKTRQVIGNATFDSGYFQLFPSAFFNYKIKEDQTIGISVSRRIDRPGYSQLNPFLFLIDVSTYSTGSPRLLPQLTWAYELSFTMKSINFSVGYRHTRDNQNIAIARFKTVFPNIPSEDNVTVQIPINLESSDYFGLSVSAPVKISKWWNMITNADAFYEKFNGNLGGTVLSSGKPAANIRINNSFTLPKGWTTELNGIFNSGGQYGFMVSDPQWGISAGVQKSILQNKGTLRFSVTDIFWTNRPKAVITYNDYIEYWHAYRESRVASLNFTYRFGKKNVQAARRRTTSSEEELRRTGN